MTRKALFLAVLLFVLPMALQAQDPNIPDTVALVASLTPDAQAAQLNVEIELWIFNDEALQIATCGFTWDNPNLQMDSAVASPLADANFGIGPFFYEDDDINVTNANQRFLFGGIAINPLFPAGATRRHWATYYFTLSSWDESDQITFDSLSFNDGSQYLFLDEFSVPFVPRFEGPITIIDPNAPSDIVLSKDSLHFSSIEGGPNPAYQEFEITSSTGDPIDFNLVEDAPWLVPTPIVGTTPRTIRVDINNLTLTADSYIDTIEVQSATAANTPLYVVVTLDVEPPPPSIGHTPNAFFFNAVANDTNPDPKTLTITNVGGGTLNWTVTNSELWLNLNPTAGSDSGDVEVSVDITGLSLGDYTDTIVISDPSADNSPRKVPVSLSVASDLPIIGVDSSFNYVVVESDVEGFDSAFFGIYNAGAGAMDFWLEWTSPRIYSITPDSGSAPQTVKVTIKIAAGVDGNNYFDTVWVHSNQAINSPVPVLLFMHYTPFPANLSITPPSINYSLYECGQGVPWLPPNYSFTVNNFGGDNPVLMNIIYESDLFTVTPLTGTAPKQYSLVPKNVLLPVGTYKDTIFVHAVKNEPGPVSLVVTLNVIPGNQGPRIFLMDSVFTFVGQENTGPAQPDFFWINNWYGGCMDWTIDENVPWLSLSDSAGDIVDTVLMFPHTDGMTIGQYTDSFYIESPGAENSPKKVKAIFKVWKYHGDCNWDGFVNLLDLVYMVDYIFRAPAPDPVPERLVGDVNCDDKFNIVDLNYMVDYIFRSGPFPCGNPVKKR